MLCPNCQAEVNDDARFCPHCGSPIPGDEINRAVEPEETAPVEEAPAAVPAVEEAPAQVVEASPVVEKPPLTEEEKAAKKRKKTMIIGIVAALAVIIGAVLGVRAYINHKHEEAYAAASKALAAEDYEKALKGFKELDDFKDSKDKADFCQNSIDYEKAVKLFDEGKYDKAKEAFSKLDDFQDAQEKVTLCDNMVKYNEAEELFAAQKYAEAHEIYAELPDDEEHFEHRADHMIYCEHKQEYDQAAALLNEKKYYDAYCAFTSLGSFEDAAAKAESCKKKFPNSGETYRNKKYKGSALTLTIVPPSKQNNYIKIYKGNDLVSCVALKNGQKSSVSLPAGTYTIKDAYGTGAWFGDKDMFGDDGTYITLTNGDSKTFKLDANMIYTLTLRSNSGSGDSVGSESVDRDSF